MANDLAVADLPASQPLRQNTKDTGSSEPI